MYGNDVLVRVLALCKKTAPGACVARLTVQVKLLVTKIHTWYLCKQMDQKPEDSAMQCISKHAVKWVNTLAVKIVLYNVCTGKMYVPESNLAKPECIRVHVHMYMYMHRYMNTYCILQIMYMNKVASPCNVHIRCQ